LRRTIEHFTTDMWEGYLTAVEELTANFNQAQILADAERRLNRWVQKAQRGQVDCFTDFSLRLYLTASAPLTIRYLSLHFVT